MSEYGFEAVGENSTVTISNRTAHWCYEYVGLFTLEDIRYPYTSDVQWVDQPFQIPTHILDVTVLGGFDCPPLVFMELPYGAPGAYSTNTGGVMIAAEALSGVPEQSGAVWWRLYFSCAKVGVAPRVRIFQKNPQAASSETHGIRVWDEQGTLLFDSGRKYLWLKGVKPITLSRFTNTSVLGSGNLLPQYHDTIDFGFSLANHSVSCMAYFAAETHEPNTNYATWAKTFQYNGNSLLATWTPTHGVGGIPSHYNSTVPLQDVVRIPLYDIPALAAVIDNSFYP